jgi:hypothetical protein
VRLTQAQEAEEGADWEWWFGGRWGWHGMRVQAKKLDEGGARYARLDHVVRGTGKRQIDLLIDRADKHVPRLDPIYCFYNGVPAQSTKVIKCRRDSVPLPGCTIAHAVDVRDRLDKSGDGLERIAAISIPWSDLVCCADGRGDVMAIAATALYWLAPDRAAPTVAALPEYVERLLGDPTDRFDRDDPHLAGILVVSDLD